jgi:adenylate cyclase
MVTLTLLSAVRLSHPVVVVGVWRLTTARHRQPRPRPTAAVLPVSLCYAVAGTRTDRVGEHHVVRHLHMPSLMAPFEIGACRVEPGANEIDGQRIDFKAMEVLICLAEAAPEVVSSMVLLERVWPRVMVGDNVLHQAVTHLRKVLGDDARSPRFIENIPRRGYRLLAEVRWGTSAVTSSAVGGATRHVSARNSDQDARRMVGTSIAVLPLLNLSPEPDQEYFSDGLSEELINVLARNPELKVTSRTSAFHFKKQAADLRTIANRLGVAHVLEGSVRKSGDRIRVCVQLVEARTDKQIWSETFDRRLGDIFALQDEIARRVFEKLQVALVPPVAPRRAPDTEAYLRYLEARRLLEQGSTDAVYRAAGLLEEAVAIDPCSPCGWIELGRARAALGDQPAVDRFARRVSELDADDPIANAWLGLIPITRELKNWDLAGSAAHFNRALVNHPTNVEVLHSLIVLLFRLGRLADVVRVTSWLLDRDPMCVICRLNLGQAHLAAGKMAAAEQALTVARALAPDSLGMRLLLAWSQLLQGKAPEALSVLEDTASPHPGFQYLRAFGLRALGDSDIFPRMLAKLEADWGSRAFYLLANGSAVIGDVAAAFAWLERSAEFPAGDLMYPHLTQELTTLRDDPRWAAALERFGLLPEQLERISLNVVLPGCGD